MWLPSWATKVSLNRPARGAGAKAASLGLAHGFFALAFIALTLNPKPKVSELFARSGPLAPNTFQTKSYIACWPFLPSPPSYIWLARKGAMDPGSSPYIVPNNMVVSFFRPFLSIFLV